MPVVAGQRGAGCGERDLTADERSVGRRGHDDVAAVDIGGQAQTLVRRWYSAGMAQE